MVPDIYLSAWKSIQFGSPASYNKQKRITIRRTDPGSWESSILDIRQVWGTKDWALYQSSVSGRDANGILFHLPGRFVSKPRTLRETKKIATGIIVGRTSKELSEFIDQEIGVRTKDN
jgi:hypothetical protein